MSSSVISFTSFFFFFFFFFFELPFAAEVSNIWGLNYNDNSERTAVDFFFFFKMMCFNEGSPPLSLFLKSTMVVPRGLIIMTIK